MHSGGVWEIVVLVFLFRVVPLLTFAFLSFNGKWCCSCLDIINLLLFSHSVSFPHSWHTEEGTWVDFLHPHVKRRFLDPDTLRDFFYFWDSHLFSVWEKRCLALLLWLACWFIAHGFACLVLIALHRSFPLRCF